MVAEKDEARLVSQYLDSLMERRRGDESAAPEKEPDLDEVLELARSIAAIHLEPREGLSDRIWNQNSGSGREGAPEAIPSGGKWPQAARRLFLRHTGLAPILARLSLAGGLLLLVLWLLPPSLSGVEVLAKSDAALRSLIQPGELLLRRTKTVVTRQGLDVPTRQRVEIGEIWTDGSSPSRQIERITDDAGRLMSITLTSSDPVTRGWRYNTADFGGSYFDASDIERLRNTVEIRPDSEALRIAVSRLEPVDRARVEWIRAQTLPDGLSRQRRLNRSLFAWPSGRDQNVDFLPQVTAFERQNTESGSVIYRVETLTRRALWGDPALGPFDQSPGRLLGIRYISQATFLTERYDRHIERDDGTAIRMVSETLELRSVPAGSVPDPFAFELPSTARRVSRSADEEAHRLANALKSLGLNLPPS